MIRADAGQLSLRQYPLWRRGKVRDIFDAGEELIFVATDRVSAFDVILPNLIPGKGQVLTDVSQFWFQVTRHLCPNHVVAYDITGLDLDQNEFNAIHGRAMRVKKAARIDVECVVRARLAGSGWAEYGEYGTLAGELLPKGMSLGDALPDVRFTPATKNDTGHDVNISRSELRCAVGEDLAQRLEQLSLALFDHAQMLAAEAGFILADTKFEFGFIDGEIMLIDEVLTPDSSRYWDASTFRAGEAPPGYDKQAIRDWLVATGWNKKHPAPMLPSDVVDAALERYILVRDRLRRTLPPAEKTGAAES